jgi:hypothetical protein
MEIILGVAVEQNIEIKIQKTSGQNSNFFKKIVDIIFIYQNLKYPVKIHKIIFWQQTAISTPKINIR